MLKRILFLLAFIVIPAIVFAGSGRIKGKVIDKDSKEPLIGASVQIVGTTQGAVTDIDGNFVIINVSAGTYTLKCSYVGYQTITESNIRVNSDLTTEENFNLPAEGVQVPTVTIIAERPLVNKNATNAVRIIDNDFLSKLPSRGIDAAVQLQPGVVQVGNNVYIRGGRKDETGYQLEGVDIGNKLYGGRAVTFPSEAIEQVQVQAGGFSAQFGGANAGIVTSDLRNGNAEAWKVGLLAETDNMAKMGSKTLGTYSYGYSDYTLTLNGPITGKTLRFFGSAENTFYRSAEIDPINGNPIPQVWGGFDFTGPNALLSSNAPSYRHPHSSAVDTLNLLYQPGDRLAGSSNQYNYSGTILFDQYPLQIRAAGSYRTQTALDPIDINNILNYMRTPEHTFKDGSGNLKGTFTLDPKSYLVLSLNYVYNSSVTFDPLLGDNFNAYGDSLTNAKLGFGSSYIAESNILAAYSIFGGGNPPTGPGVSINQPGTIVSGYDKINLSNLGGRADYTTEIGKHEIKLGGEYTKWTIRRFNAGATTSSGTNATVGRAAILANPNYTSAEKTILLRKLNPGIDSYGYDVYGNQIDNDITQDGNITDFGPRHPVFGAGYLEDKIEFNDLVIRAGLRYDHISSDGFSFADPTHLHPIDSLGVLSSSDLKKTDATDQISPRLGFSFPVTDRTVFHAQYGKFIQQSQLRDAYLGMGSTYHYIAGGNFVITPSGYGLKPERTTQYEIGFQQQFSDLASFDVTAFYKDIRDQVQYTEVLPGAGAVQKAYPAFINGDFSTTEGLELSFNIRRTNRLQASVNYTFQDAGTTGSNPTSLAGAAVTGGAFIPHYIFPFDQNETHRGDINLDYRFGKDDGGSILERAGINLLAQFNSGHPFTLLNIPDPDVTDPRFRTPVEQIGSSSTPWFFQLDGRVDKTWTLGSIDLNVYVYVQNLLGTNNAVNVYPRTGDPGNDGWLSTPNGIAAVQQNGPQYVSFYNAIFNGANATNGVNVNTGSLNSNYGIPRMIRFGIRLDY